MYREFRNSFILSLSILLLSLAVFAAPKPVQLLVGPDESTLYEADTKADAFVIKAPGTYHLKGKIINNITSEEIKKKLDIVFILDASGSMCQELHDAKEGIKEIMEEIESECHGCMKAGVYVFEGSTDKPYLFSHFGFCDGSNDVGGIRLTGSSNKIKNALDTVGCTGWIEPWAHLAKQVISANYGWRSDTVKAVVVITDEESDYCTPVCDPEGPCTNESGHFCSGTSEAASALKAKDAWFFGIIGNNSAPKPCMEEILNAGVKGGIFTYTNPSQVSDKVKQIIYQLLSSDTFVVGLEEGEDWDNLPGANFEIGEVGRDGQYTFFDLTLTLPSTYPEKEVFLKYKLWVKGNPEIADYAWVKVIFGDPPQAVINPIDPPFNPSIGAVVGDVPLEVKVNAEGTQDPDDDLAALHWDCDSDGTFEYDISCTNPSVDCTATEITCGPYTEKDTLYTITLQAEDELGLTGTAQLLVRTNPNKNPDVNLILPEVAYVNEPTVLRANANDPDGTIISYKWDFGDGNIFYCDPSISDCSQVTHIFSEKTSYSITVEVTDDDCAKASDTNILQISNRPPNPPIISALPLAGVPPLYVDFIVVDASDPDGDPIVGYDWNFGDGTIVSTTEPFYNDYLYTEPNKVYYATCRAKDIDGAVSDWSEPVAIHTVQISGIVSLYAKDTNVGEKTAVVAKCTGDASQVIINIVDKNGDVKYTSPPIACDGSMHELDYVFDTPGVYGIIAKVHPTTSSCVVCSLTYYILVKQHFPKTQVSEIPVWAVPILALTILVITDANRKMASNKK